jgi:hypothetical protein
MSIVKTIEFLRTNSMSFAHARRVSAQIAAKAIEHLTLENALDLECGYKNPASVPVTVVRKLASIAVVTTDDIFVKHCQFVYHKPLNSAEFQVEVILIDLYLRIAQRGMYLTPIFASVRTGTLAEFFDVIEAGSSDVITTGGTLLMTVEGFSADGTPTS